MPKEEDRLETTLAKSEVKEEKPPTKDKDKEILRLEKKLREVEGEIVNYRAALRCAQEKIGDYNAGMKRIERDLHLSGGSPLDWSAKGDDITRFVERLTVAFRDRGQGDLSLKSAHEGLMKQHSQREKEFTALQEEAAALRTDVELLRETLRRRQEDRGVIDISSTGAPATIVTKGGTRIEIHVRTL